MSGTAPPALVIALAMASVTYLLRVTPLLAGRGGAGRLPRRSLEYLRLVAPSILVGLAAVHVAVLVPAGPAGSDTPVIHIDAEWVAVAACIGVVAVRRSLFPGLVVAVLVATLARIAGMS